MKSFCLSTLVALFFTAAAAQQVDITIDAGTPVARINPLIFGINTARWDESLFPGPPDDMLMTCDRDAIGKIAASGITMLKYPGGNDADSYIWNSPSNSPTEMNTDEYIALCRQVHAEPFITINFNEPPQLAADWVHYCKERGYNVRYWEVGDEQWGTWAKGHTSPEEYAKKYAGFVSAMRAVDPEIKVATNVPLGPHPENWTTRVLKAVPEYIDMLTVTYYPQQWGKENDDTLFASARRYSNEFTSLRREVEQVLGKERASQLMYINVGYNSVNHSPGPQTVSVVNALWVADMLGTMAETSTDVACYWAVHNAFPPRGGDYGYLSSEGRNTPRPVYEVFRVLSKIYRGEALQCRSSDPRIVAHASRDGKEVCVFIASEDSSAPRSAEVRIGQFHPGPIARCWTLDGQRPVAGERTLPVGSAFALTLPPYSLTVLQLVSADSVRPPENLARRAHPSASTYSTIGPSFGPASAVDGNTSTRWCSAAWTQSGGDETQWYELMWDSAVTASRVILTWGESYATSYRLEGSQDGTSWSLIKATTAGSGGTEALNFPPVALRALRVLATHGTKGISAYAIRELEVYAQ